MKAVLVFLFLTICSVQDLRHRTLPVWLLLLGLLAALAWQLFMGWLTGHPSLAELFLGACTGLALFVVGRAAPGAVGAGDAWVFLDIGLLLGLEDTIGLLWISMMGALLFAALLLLLKKAGRKTKLPMVPFIWAGFLIMQMWGRV